MKPDLSSIVEVASFENVQEVNKRLASGWVLLSVADGKDGDGYPVTWYQLGLPRQAESDKANEG